MEQRQSARSSAEDEEEPRDKNEEEEKGLLGSDPGSRIISNDDEDANATVQIRDSGNFPRYTDCCFHTHYLLTYPVPPEKVLTLSGTYELSNK